MNKNVGGMDKTLRIILGVAIMAIGLFTGSWWGLIGIIPLVTALVNRCPIYLPFGLSTCKTKTSTEKN
ncbi:MAG: DUF2892 domain-containing protein [Ignavibacteriae bacterium HGW-Ignavibacteriae-2]|jgi:hypothetical protein|nr:DUF2892 domain-containing protein [Bacteroidota bacterium]PKL87892.1 MAG: DUF2892 domain-containing protein [Ignavibacteriae bacterium HGW-Ignavibacteriae-2]